MRAVSCSTGSIGWRRFRMPHGGIGLAGIVVLVLAVAARGQVGPEVNRRVVEVGMQPSPTTTAAGSFFDIIIFWQAALRSDTGTSVDAGTEIAVELNGTEVQRVAVAAVFDSGSGPGGCTAGTCLGTCGTATVDSVAETLTCADDTGPCECRTASITTALPGVPLVAEDVITIIIYPAPGAVPDADGTDDGGSFTIDTWNRRVVDIQVVPSGGTGNLFEVRGLWTVDLDGAATVPVDMSTTLRLSVNGVPQEDVDGDDCLIWDIQDGCAHESGQEVQLVCGGGVCSLPTKTVHFAPIPLNLGDVLNVTLFPAPGALPPLPGIPGDDQQEQNFGGVIPAASTWGLIVLAMLVVLAGTVIVRSVTTNSLHAEAR